MKKVNL